MTERIWIVSQMTRLADPYARYFAMGMRYSKLNSKFNVSKQFTHKTRTLVAIFHLLFLHTLEDTRNDYSKSSTFCEMIRGDLSLTGV